MYTRSRENKNLRKSFGEENNMNGRFALAFAILGLAVASAKTYTVTLNQAATLNGAQLQPGTYKVEVVDQKAILHLGKETSEAPVKVEDAGHKYDATTVRLANENGKVRLQEIHIGGTRTKLVLGEQMAAGDGQ